MDKAAVRQEMRARRRALTPDAKARAAACIDAQLAVQPALVRALAAGRQKAPVAAYLASPSEVDLSGTIARLLAGGVPVAVPQWTGEAYVLSCLKGLRDEDLRVGPMGIREPKGTEAVSPAEVAVWLVPGLAFTPDGRRLGYGGGWYDRLLTSARATAVKIGIAFACQVVPRLPEEPHDRRVDAVVSERAAP